jgi:hypothetical protein
MDRTKPVQEGVRVKLTAGTTWDSLAGMTPEQIRDRNLFPPGFLPLPHPKHQEGGMVFPRFLIDDIKRNPALLSHAAKIPGTESYHPDRSEVGFGYGLPGHLSACPPDWPNDGGGPPPDFPPARFSRRVGLGYAQGAGFRTGRAMAAGARSQPMSSNRDIRRAPASEAG